MFGLFVLVVQGCAGELDRAAARAVEANTDDRTSSAMKLRELADKGSWK
ncbi:MAG: hypothetical protein ACI9K2_005808 [Myxococcota bacterium]|jgi:hypothetical protein